MNARHIVLLFLLLTLPTTPSCGAQPVLPESPPPSEGKLEIREVPLGRMISSRDDIRVSPDQKRVAFKVKKGEKEVVVVDGKEGQTYDLVRWGPFFSPDSQRIAYSARRGGSQSIVVDGIEGKGYEPSDEMYPIFFSADSKRVAFMARRGGKTMMVIDGVEGKPYRELKTQPPPTVFSPDSKRYIYAGKVSEKQWVVVVDGVEGKPYDSVDSEQFSPDSRRVLYEAHRGDGSFVVVDRVEGPVFDYVSMFSEVGTHISADSKRVAYIVWNTHGKFKKVMVVDGVPGKEYDDIEFVPWIFSADSKHTAYTATLGGKKCVVLDSKEGPFFDDVGYLRFSPDGKHLAYTAASGGEAITICDGKEVSKGLVAFSPDWVHMAYLKAKGRNWMVVLDGKEGLQHGIGEPWRTQLFFSPDSQRLAYRASQAREIEFVVVDGTPSIRYQLVDVGNPIFSPDSKHFAYWAAPASGKWHVFVDRAYSDAYDEPVFGSKLAFDGPDTLHALAVRGGEMYRVEIKIAAPHKETETNGP